MAYSKTEKDLVSMARESKSFDAFLSELVGPYYHGTKTAFSVFDPERFGTGEGSDMLGGGVYVASFEKAKDYGQVILECYLPKDIRIIDYDAIKYHEKYNRFFDKVYKDYPDDRSEIKTAFARKYFDAVSYASQVLVFDAKNVLTETRLKEIYEKAK